MNYIKSLQLKIEEKNQEIEQLNEKIESLKRYVNLPKFHSECELSGYVNIKDILLRLND